MNLCKERYFDYAATSPMRPEALEAYVEAAQRFPANPGSMHVYGHAARSALAYGREQICAALNFHDGRLIFTSGGTEANNLILQSALARGIPVRIARNTHPSCWYATMESSGQVGVLPLNRQGLIDREFLIRQLKEHQPTLISVSHACNETGVVQPVEELADLCERGGHLLHIDATQTVGHMPIDLEQIPAHFISFSAHKFGGPRGVGGLLAREAPLLTSQLHGGSQEGGLRAGTENLPAAMATAVALESAQEGLTSEIPRLRSLASTLANTLCSSWSNVLINSDLEKGLPGLVSFCFPGHSGHDLVLELSAEGFAVSAGSACHAGSVLPSRAVLSMGRTEKEALGSLRVSFGEASTTSSASEFSDRLLALLHLSSST